MKERWRYNKEQLVSAEEGLKSAELVTRNSICSCDRLIQYAKLVFYIELILFVGWGGYTLFYSNYPAVRDVKSSTVPTEVLKLSVLKDFKDTVDKIKTQEYGPLKEISIEISPTNDQLNVESTIKKVNFDDNFISNHLETTDRDARFKGTLESNSDGDKEIMVKVPSFDVSESKETESLDYVTRLMIIKKPSLFASKSKEADSSENGSDKESGLFTDDSSETVLDSECDDDLGHLYETKEKDESNDVSESRETSFEKETEDQNEKENSSFNSEDVSSAEFREDWNRILQIIKGKQLNMYFEILRNNLYESLANSVNDKEPLFWEESTESSIAFSNESSEEETPRKSVESEILDTSEADETISDSKYDFWTPSTSVPFAERQSDEKTYYTEDSTEKNTYVETSTASNEEDNGSVLDRLSEYLSNLEVETATSSGIENVSSDLITADTSDEDYSTLMGSSWDYFSNLYDDPFSNVHHETDKPLQIDSGDEKIESIQFGPRSKNEDLTDRKLCSIEFVNGLRVIKCSWNSANDDHSSDSSSTTESKSDYTTKRGLRFLGRNYSFDNIYSGEENVSENTESSDEKSDIYNSDVIDKIVKESIETSLNSADLSETSESSKFEISDNPVSSTTKDSSEWSSY